MFSSHFYFLALRNTFKGLDIFDDETKSYISMESDRKFWFIPHATKARVFGFIIDETIIQIGSQHFWLWICIY